MPKTVHTFQFDSLDPSAATNGVGGFFDPRATEAITASRLTIERLEAENEHLKRLLIEAQQQATHWAASAESLDKAARALQEAVHQWRRKDTLAISDIEQEVIVFSLNLVETILGAVPLPQRLRAALNQLHLAETAVDASRIRMHPDTLSALGAIPGGWVPHPTAIIADDSVAAGEVICEVGDRRVTAGFAAALDNLRRTLTGLGE